MAVYNTEQSVRLCLTEMNELNFINWKDLVSVD